MSNIIRMYHFGWIVYVALPKDKIYTYKNKIKGVHNNFSVPLITFPLHVLDYQIADWLNFSLNEKEPVRVTLYIN